MVCNLLLEKLTQGYQTVPEPLPGQELHEHKALLLNSLQERKAGLLQWVPAII